jgi:hypothetical protein
MLYAPFSALFGLQAYIAATLEKYGKGLDEKGRALFRPLPFTQNSSFPTHGLVFFVEYIYTQLWQGAASDAGGPAFPLY